MLSIKTSQVFRVYRNLHKHCYSVQTKSPKGGGWRLSFHTDYLTLNGVEFKVYERTRQKVIETKQKSIHAFVVGSLSASSASLFNTNQLENLTKVSYNPYKAGYFIASEGNRVDRADIVYFTPYGVYIR